MKIQLLRFYHPHFTFGEVHIDNQFFAYSLERAWANNQTAVSCIPEGIYPLKLRVTEKRGSHILVDKVPSRSLILVHSMNDVSTHDQNNKVDSLGCIGLADRLIFSGNDMKGQFSTLAVKRFNALVLPLLKEGKNIEIEIFAYQKVFQQIASV